MRINHRRFQVFTRPPETSERRHPFTLMSKLWTYSFYLLTIFGCLQLSTYLLRKQGNSSSRGCESQGRSREEEKEGEEEEKDFISNSGQGPRHAEENNQNLSLSCHKKGSLLPCFLNFQHSELTNQVELRSQCQIQEVRSITSQPERAFTTQRRFPHQRINTDSV